MISIKCGSEPFSRATSSIVQKAILQRRCFSSCGSPVKYFDPKDTPQGEFLPREGAIIDVRVKDGVTQVQFASTMVWEAVKVGGIIKW